MTAQGQKNGARRSDMHAPPHPGEILREEVLAPLDLSITDAAAALGVTRKTLSALVNERQGVSPEMALRLGKAFATTAELWTGLQERHDLWRARQAVDLSGVRVLQES